MTSQHPRFLLISLSSAALLGVLAATPASAAESHCKGLAQAQCGTTEGCGWIDAYTRKDGKTVEGYCKKATLPPGAGRGKGAAGTAAAPAAAAAAAPTPATAPAPTRATGKPAATTMPSPVQPPAPTR